MADDVSFHLQQVAEAASPQRFQLLGRPRGEWFRASSLEGEFHLERGSIRAHAETLHRLNLLDRREAREGRRVTYEWSVNDEGAELRHRLELLLDMEVSRADRADAVAVLTFDDAHELNDDLRSSLERLLNATAEPTKALRFTRSG